MKTKFTFLILVLNSILSFSQGVNNDAFRGTASGTNSYTVTINAITSSSPYDGQKIWVKFTNANTSTATLKVLGGGSISYSALAITLNGSALVSGDITANQYIEFIYYLSGTSWQMQRPSNSPSSLKLFHVLANGNTAGANNILMNDNQYIGAVTDGDQYTWAYFYDDLMLIAAQDISTNAFSDFSANITDQANPHAVLEINSSAGNSSTYDVTKDFHQVAGSIATFEGIRYDIDYSANYTSRSLIDKGFADGRYPIQQDKKVATTFTCTTGGGGLLENITGLSANIVSGHNYHFRACLFFTANIGTNDGSKVAIGGTATASDVAYTVNLFASGSGAFVGSALQTALGSGVGQVAYSAGQYIIEGTIFCNGTGTLTVQGTENTDVSSPPTFRKGSTFTVTEIQ